MNASIFETFVRGCKAGLIYGAFMLVYAHVVTKGITHIHDLDFTLLQDVGPFLLVGLCFGGLLGIADAYVRWPAWLLSAGIWALFVLPTLLLHFVAPERYTLEFWQHLQGLVLALALGLIYGWLGRSAQRQDAAA